MDLKPILYKLFVVAIISVAAWRFELKLEEKDVQGAAELLAALAVGWVALKRPGDQKPLVRDIDSPRGP